MGEKTTLTKATKKSESLRTTIPHSIVKQFELQEGDKLDWKLEARNGEIVIIVVPDKRI